MEAGAVKGDGGAGACAASELPDPQDALAAQTDGTPAVQPCKHFSLRGYVDLVKRMDPKFCSLYQIFNGQQRFAEHHTNSRPFSVPKFPRWDCSKCVDKEKMADQVATSRAVSMGKNVTSDGCSIKFVRSALVPTSVDFRSLFPCEVTCTQQLSQGKNADRSTLLKSTTPEGNSKCNSPCGVAQANTSSPKKDLQGPCNKPDATANISDNASVDVVAIPEDSHIRANRDGNSMAIPSSPKFSEQTLKPNAEDTVKTNEVPNVVCPNVSGQKGDQVSNSGQCEAAPKRHGRSMKKGKSTTRVDGSVGKLGKKKQRKRSLSAIIKDDQAGSCRNGGVDADLCEDPRSTDDGSYMNWRKNIPKKARTEKKDTTTTSAQKGDGSIEISNLERNMQSTDDMSPTEAEHSTQRSLSKVKTMSKRKMPSTANVQHDSVVPVSHQMVGEVSSNIANKSKDNGVDVVVEKPILMNWTQSIPKKLRTGRKDSRHKASYGSLQYTVDKFASKDVHHDFVSSVTSKKKALPATSTQQGDENVHTNNLERNLQNTDGMYQIESVNCTQWSLSKANSMSLSKRKIPSAVNAQQGNANAENGTGKGAILWRDDQCQLESGSSVQRHPSKVSLGKRGIQHVTTLDKKMPKKKKKQKQEAMHEKQAVMDDDVVELVARNQDERSMINETDSSQSKISEDEDCIIIFVKDGPNNVSVLDTTSQQKLSVPEIYQNALQDPAASTTQATSMHPLELQIAGNINSAQEPQTHLSMEEVVTIAKTSPLLSQHRDQSSTEAPVNCWSDEEANKLMADSFKRAPWHLNAVDAVDLTSTHVVGASNNYYPSQEPAISAPGHCADRAVNQFQARTYQSTVSAVEAGNLYDRTNAGPSGSYPRETTPAAHLLRLTESSMLAESYRSQMEFQLRNFHNAHNQQIGSARISYGSNINRKVPLTLEDLSLHQLQQNMSRLVRPRAVVGLYNPTLQQEIANWPESSGTQPGYRIGVSNGITSFDINRRENIEILNPGMFSARRNGLKLGSVSSSPGFSSARNSTAQPWTRGQGRVTNPLDSLVRQDICPINRNPADITVISDDNEYMREDL